MKVLPISEKFFGFGEEILKKLKDAGIRCEMDQRDEKIGYKIRSAQMEKVPYMLIVGQKEEETGTVSVRSRDDGDLGSQELDAFIQKVVEEGKE